MKFVVSPGPYQRGTKKTSSIMRDLLIALLVIWVATVIYHFTIGVAYGLKAIFMVVVAAFVTLLCDILVHALRYKKEAGPYFKNLIDHILNNFSIITALIFAFTLPIGTPYYVIILGSIFATLLVKYAFGGFGHNIFNPAAFARIFVTITFSSSLVSDLGVAGITPPSLTAGATITTAFSGVGVKWLSASLEGLNVTMGQLWLGNYQGALGETFTLLILLLGIGLIIRKVVNWRTPVFYLGTVALTALLIALFIGVNPFAYLSLHLSLGGLMFGAIFMLTDPVSSPTSMFGKALIGIIAGLITVLIRIQGNLPEGVVFAIAIANVFSPLIDRLTISMTNKNMVQKWTTLATMLVLALGLNSGIAIAKADIKEPPVTSHKALSGSYTSKACDSCDEQTQEVVINLDKSFEIVSIQLKGKNTTGKPYTTSWSTREAEIVSYYESLSIIQIMALTDSPLEEEQLAAGATKTSQRLLGALQAALANVEIYTGSATSNAFSDYYNDQTTTATVYVIDGVIEGLDASGQLTTGGKYKTDWEADYEDIRDYYLGMTVTDLMALNSLPKSSDGFVAGLTYSVDRLFDAIQDALSTHPSLAYKSLLGSFTSQAHASKDAQTQEVTINLDKSFKIVSIKLSGENTTGGTYTTNWDEREAAIVSYYESLSIAQIMALDDSALIDDVLVAGVTVTSARLLSALQDALKDVEIYTGNATSNAFPEHYADQTTTATVYVIDGIIEGLDASGDLTTGGKYKTDWEADYENIRNYYLNMSVTDFKALGSLPDSSDGFVAGLTISVERLFDAIADALSSYGA